MLVSVKGSVSHFVALQLGRRNFFTSGTARLTLVLPPHNDLTPMHTGSARPAPVQHDVPVNFSGMFELAVPPNDQLDPAGTVYAFSLLVPNVNFVPQYYVFEGPGPFNLDHMTPIDAEGVRQRQVHGLHNRLQRHETHILRHQELSKTAQGHRDRAKWHQAEAARIDAEAAPLVDHTRHAENLRLQLRELESK